MWEGGYYRAEAGELLPYRGNPNDSAAWGTLALRARMLRGFGRLPDQSVSRETNQLTG